MLRKQETVMTKPATESEVIFAVFLRKDNAIAAINVLSQRSFNSEDISVILRDDEASVKSSGEGASRTAARVAGGATAGGLAGLIAGLGAVVFPGVGGILIGGPVAAALGVSGAAVAGGAAGALAGGLVGVLSSLGLPEEDVKDYEEKIQEGGLLVAVPTRRENDMEAIDVLLDHGAVDVRTIHVSPEKKNWSSDPWRTGIEAGSRRVGEEAESS